MLSRLLALGMACLALAVWTAPAAARSGLAGEWKLDEGSGTVAADSSGNGNTGTLSGAVSWVAGVSGRALSFDGSGGQVRVPNNPALEPQSAVTVAAWVKASSSPGVFRYVVAKGATGCVAASYGMYSGPNGGLEFYISRQRGTVYAASSDEGAGVWDGAWHLAVGTFDGTTIRLYVDGHEVGAGIAYPGALEYLLQDSNDLFVGNYPGCISHGFSGAIDDVRIWSAALDAAQVQALEPDESGGPPAPTPGPARGGTPGSGGGSTTGTTGVQSSGRPSVYNLRLSSSSLTVGPSGRVTGSSHVTISYAATQAARLTITLLRAEPGVVRRQRCVKGVPNRRRHGARCSRVVEIASFTRNDRAGTTLFRLGWLTRRRLAPGTYRLAITPRAHGTVGKTVSISFVVRRARRTHR